MGPDRAICSGPKYLLDTLVVMNPRLSIFCADLASLQREALSFALELQQAFEHAKLVTLSGELGAGKTSFVQGVARALGVAEPITSPTFVIEKVYTLTGGVFTHLVHIDAYRLTEPRELARIRFMDRYADTKALILLEWPEMVASELPPADVSIQLSVQEQGRAVRYSYAGT